MTAKRNRAPKTEDHIKTLVHDPDNARKHNPKNIGLIVESLQAVGAARSIVIDENNLILAGNGVIEAAGEAGITKLQVVDADGETIVAVRRTGLTPKQKRLLALADNRANELSEWDDAKLNSLLEGLTEEELQKLALTEADLQKLGVEQPDAQIVDAEAQVDRAEELQKQWKTATGQLWTCGEHKIICGDSTDPNNFDRLVGKELATLVWTDPPYGVDYGSKLEAGNAMGYKVRHIKNDNLTPDKLADFIRTVFKNICSHCVKGGSIYAAAAGDMLPVAIESFKDSGFDFRWQLVWLKDQLVLSRSDYHFRHENILYGWKPDGAHYFTPERDHDSIFEVARPKSSEEHPTMKPVELIVQMINNSSQRGDIVIDPFNGSGSTMLACETTGRKYLGCELEPAYVAVTLERFRQATGVQPQLLK